DPCRRAGPARAVAGRQWIGPSPRRDHHGWQRPLGEAAGPAARGGSQGRRGGGTPDYAGRRRSWRRGPDAVRFLVGELAAELGRDCRPHRLDALLSRARAGHPAERKRPPEADRRLLGVRPGSRPATRQGARAHRRQPAAHPGRSAELRFARGDCGRCSPGGAQGGGGRTRPPYCRRAQPRMRAADARPPRARPADPHVRRSALVQLPAVAGGLCRVGLQRRALARFWRARVRRCARAVRGTAAAVRRAV
ncbi:MAG: Undecaprenyl diphosphate synthase, partial [uncultured Sphingomonas sp.]